MCGRVGRQWPEEGPNVCQCDLTNPWHAQQILRRRIRCDGLPPMDDSIGKRWSNSRQLQQFDAAGGVDIDGVARVATGCCGGSGVAIGNKSARKATCSLKPDRHGGQPHRGQHRDHRLQSAGNQWQWWVTFEGLGRGW